MNIEQAKKLLEREGYGVTPPPGKAAMLSLMEQLRDWCDDDYDPLSDGDKSTYNTIIKLIEEHAK